MGKPEGKNKDSAKMENIKGKEGDQREEEWIEGYLVVKLIRLCFYICMDLPQ